MTQDDVLEVIEKMKYMPKISEKSPKDEQMVLTCKNDDRTWKDTGFDEEEFETNLQWYKSRDDHKITREYEAMKKYRE